MTEQAEPTGVSVLIRHEVRPGVRAAYEHWVNEIIDVSSRFPGHQGVNIFKHPEPRGTYEIAVRFANREAATGWLESNERRELVDQAREYLAVPGDVEISTGVDNWFQPLNAPVNQPRRWKQWLLTTVVIWALTMAVPAVLAPVFAAVPVLGLWGVRQALVAAILVALVMYLIMPVMVRLLGRWLYR